MIILIAAEIKNKVITLPEDDNSKFGAMILAFWRLQWVIIARREKYGMHEQIYTVFCYNE